MNWTLPFNAVPLEFSLKSKVLVLLPCGWGELAGAQMMGTGIFLLVLVWTLGLIGKVVGSVVG